MLVFETPKNPNRICAEKHLGLKFDGVWGFTSLVFDLRIINNIYVFPKK